MGRNGLAEGPCVHPSSLFFVYLINASASHSHPVFSSFDSLTLPTTFFAISFTHLLQMETQSSQNYYLYPLNANPSIGSCDPKMTSNIHSGISLPWKTYFCKKNFKLSFPFKKQDDKKHTHEPLFVKCLQMMKRNANQYPYA